MKIIEAGHIYDLRFLGEQKGGSQSDYDNERRLVFANREPGTEHAGTQTQEVLRALIDRTYHCDNCLPSELNAFIIHHLRMALVYHEMRALQRKAEKGLYEPEMVELGPDGHFDFGAMTTFDQPKAAPRRKFVVEPNVEKPRYNERP